MNAPVEIDVLVHGAGHTSRATADSAENALYAARTLWDDIVDTVRCYGTDRSLTAIFVVDGQHVRTVVGHRP